MSPSIIVNSKIRRQISAHLRCSGNREIGGILFGEQIAPNHFRLVDFSVDIHSGSSTQFYRSPDQHSEKLNQLFERTKNNYDRYNYLGEWHSHPNYSTQPSTQDCPSSNDLRLI